MNVLLNLVLWYLISLSRIPAAECWVLCVLTILKLHSPNLHVSLFLLEVCTSLLVVDCFHIWSYIRLLWQKMEAPGLTAHSFVQNASKTETPWFMWVLTYCTGSEVWLDCFQCAHCHVLGLVNMLDIALSSLSGQSLMMMIRGLLLHGPTLFKAPAKNVNNKWF